MANQTTALIVTSVRIPPETHEQLKALADADHRSLSAEVRWLIEQESAARKAAA